jgi:large subunit ribosomal protein L5
MSKTKDKIYTPRLKEQYLNQVVPALQKQFNYTSSMQVPRIKKICLNQGIGIAVSDRKLGEGAVVEMTSIAGQKAVTAKSRKDIANFKLRKGVAVGVRVTLRGNNMYEFLDRLISAALPRIRDFRGVDRKGFDGHGNYTLGITEQIIFPEINMDKVTKIMGMDITFVTSAPTNEEALALLESFGMPFKKEITNEPK